MSRAGFVLVGGKSSRMGRDKALLPYGGGALAEHVAARVAVAAGSVALVGSPHRYGDLPYRCIEDRREDCGPAAGVEAALEATEADWNLIVACDMPSLPVSFLVSLLEAAEAADADCLVPVSAAGRPEPLCAVYHRRCLPAFRDALRRNVRKMTDVLKEMRVAFYRAPEGAWSENLNTPEDWAAHRPPRSAQAAQEGQ